MKFIDMHCDTLMYSYERPDFNLLQTDRMMDLVRMKQGGQMAQFFAVFLLSEGAKRILGVEHPVDDDEFILELSSTLKRNVAQHSDLIAMAHNADEMLANWEAGKMSAIMTMEDGRAVNGDLNKIKEFYDLGVRALSLTWNYENCFGSPNSKDPIVMATGLTDFGKDAIVYMQDLGMMVDVSHLSDGGFMDVARLAKVPFVATHSNCRALSPHQRNLTDEMIRILADKGGVSGINFGAIFINEDITCRVQRVETIVKHIEHFMKIGGTDCVGLGSDFDGIGGDLEVGSCDKVPLIFDAMSKAGFSDDLIEKVAYKNVLRVMKESMK